MKRNVVIVTDCNDIAYNELRATILSNIDPRLLDSVSIEPVASIEPFSIVNGNFILKLLADSYPPSTIFLVVLNPLKERPERLIGRTADKDFVFIGANTGAFTRFFDTYGLKEIYELKDPGFYPFGGKYVHAPAVASIVSGIELSNLGNPFDTKKLRKLDDKDLIVHVDNFGLMKCTNILDNPVVGEKYQINVNDRSFVAKYDKRMMSNDTGEWIIYPGSSFGLIEIGKVRENGAKELGVKAGQAVTIKKLP